MFSFKFKKVMILFLGMIVSIASYAMNDQISLRPNKSVILRFIPTSGRVQNDIKKRMKCLISSKDRLKFLKEERQKKFLNDKYVLNELTKASFEVMISEEKVELNLFFWILSSDKLDKKSKKDVFLFFIDLFKNNNRRNQLEGFINDNGKLVVSNLEKKIIFRHSLFTYALGQRQFDIVESLLNSGARPEILFYKNRQNKSFMDLIPGLVRSYERFREKIRIIISSFSKDACDKINEKGQVGSEKKKKTILERAIDCQQYGFVKDILIGVKNENFKNLEDNEILLHRVIKSLGFKDEKTYYHNCVKEGIDLIAFLIEVAKVNVNFADDKDKKRTPLLSLSRVLKGSVVHGNSPRRIECADAIKVLRILLKAGADLSLRGSHYGRNDFISWLVKDIKFSLGETTEKGGKRGSITPKKLFESRIKLLFEVFFNAGSNNKLTGVKCFKEAAQKMSVVSSEFLEVFIESRKEAIIELSKRQGFEFLRLRLYSRGIEGMTTEDYEINDPKTLEFLNKLTRSQLNGLLVFNVGMTNRQFEGCSSDRRILKDTVCRFRILKGLFIKLIDMKIIFPTIINEKISYVTLN